MGSHRRGDHGFRATGRRRLGLLAALLGVACVLLAAAGSSAAGPTIEAAGGAYGYYWRPASAEVGPGGMVAFENPSSVVPHGVTWTGGPETPSCSGVPINEGKKSWSGSCSFAQLGTYSFDCPVHPTEMTGTITVSASGGPPPTPPPPETHESPLEGTASQALKIAGAQHGVSVRGSIALSAAGAGSRLQVDLLAGRASLLGAGHAGSVRVGRLVRSSLGAGRNRFTVSLKPFARRALRRRERLRLTARVVLTPPQGDTLRLSRGVLLHG